MCDLRLVSCLEKVFADSAPSYPFYAPEGLRGEEVFFQLSWKNEVSDARTLVNLKIESEISGLIRAERVRFVPVLYPTIPGADDDYLRKTPGLYPDLLEPIGDSRLRAYGDHWESAWITISPTEELKAGSYPIRLSLVTDEGEELGAVETNYTLTDAALPEQKLIHTRWFHCDGLCRYYNVRMFSEKFWLICESFMRAAVRMSVNCLLTPVHTPPLDTRVGGERLTCQLVDIEKEGDSYAFGFEKLERWIRLAQECGIKYFEIAHLFTQWGAAHAPKIVALENGVKKKIFGWDTDAGNPEYVSFLKQYLKALKKELKKLDVLDKCFFHISDEPNLAQLESYRRARESVKKELKGLNCIDALSNLDFYREGLVEKPVCATNHIRPFLDEKVSGLWAYYCIGQHTDVSNVFVAMPSQRTRIIGTQLYKYDIEGFLQWGFNFYNSQYSLYPVNPYETTDGDGFSPAGDCFIVYPGKDGQAYDSLRARLVRQAVNDLRAFEKLEQYIGKEAVVSLIEEGVSPIEFDRYPRDAEYLLKLRHKVNSLIAKYASREAKA